MPNKKISQFPILSNPTNATIFPVVVNGANYSLNLSSLAGFINTTDAILTGGTFSNGTLVLTNATGGTVTVNGVATNSVTGGTYSNNILTLTNVSGGTINVTGFTDYFITGGTYSANTITFTDNNNKSFNVTGITQNTKYWLENKNQTVKDDETIVISGNYVLSGTNLTLETSGTQLSIGNINFDKYAQIFIGGYLLLIDSNIVNNGLISVGGAIIFSGNSTITGTGIIT